MKTILGIFVALVFSGSVNAAPFQYTFTGTVTSALSPAGIITDTYGLADASEFLGHAVEYIFVADFQASGTETLNDASTLSKTDTADLDWFYSDLLSGSLLDEKDGGFYNSATDTAEYNYGFDRLTPPGFDRSRVQGGSRDSVVYVFSSTDSFSAWQVGDSFFGVELAFDSLSQHDTLQSGLTLTDISPAVVPVPAAAWLFGSALGLVGFLRRRAAR